MPIGGLRTDYSGLAMQAQAGVASTMARMDKEKKKPEKDVSGALQAAAGGALAGSAYVGKKKPAGMVPAGEDHHDPTKMVPASEAKQSAMSPAWGAGIGAAAGVALYYLS